jgi:phage/plasmid-associated DNA primase
MPLQSLEKLTTVTKSQPCRHCGKPDWCYRIGELEICNRQAEPATGWIQTAKTDREGNFYYAPAREQKPIRRKQTRHWEYPARDGSKLVRVCRVDDGKGKKIWQEKWDGGKWIKGLKGIQKDQIPIYRYAEVRRAISQGQTIHIVEGEPCADALWSLGIPATTNIGGAGKWRETHSDDLEGVESIVLCPDCDKPGVEHMQKVDQTLPIGDARWLCAFPDSPAWENLPQSGGVDVADWIADFKLSAEDIKKAVIQDTEAFRAKIEKQFPTSIEAGDEGSEKKKKPTLPPPNVTADAIAELYRDKLAWESEYQLWRHYGAKHDGIWSEESVESVRGIVHAYLRSHPEAPPFNAGYVSSVLTILQSDLEVKEWNEQQGLIPLRDGVLSQETLEVSPHSPGYRFTWQLPFNWSDRGIGCDPVEEFLLKITGSPEIAEVLLCYLAAIVTRRADLQRYLELIGGGGTGKSTYMALAKALAGEENAVSSRLSLLEKNQFETAKFYRKLLVLFPDSERWQGEVSVLKQLTGQDPMRYERKGIQQCKDYVYHGMVILSANEPPESSDRTSGQERRKLTVGLDNRIPEYEGRNLAEEFKPFLPGLLKRVLEIPKERVTALIKHTDKNVAALAQKKWAQLIETNPIAAWVDENVVISLDAKGYIGKDDPEQSARWLYANFCKFQRESGHRGIPPVKRFSANLRDLLKNQMKVSIFEGRDRNGAYIEGIGLRCFYDPNGTNESRPITENRILNDVKESDNKLEESCNESVICDGFVTDGDGCVTVETLTSAACDGCDGFYTSLQNLVKNQGEGKEATNNTTFCVTACLEQDQSCVSESNKNPSHPSHSTLARVSTITHLSQLESNPSQEEVDSWMTEENLTVLASDLEVCDNREALFLLHQCYPGYAMNAACKRLSAEKHAQIKQWDIELNQPKDAELIHPELSFISEPQQVMISQPIDDRQYRVHSEFFGQSFEPCVLLKKDELSQVWTFRHIPSDREIQIYSKDSFELVDGCEA